jgi:hypothetical protein
LARLPLVGELPRRKVMTSTRVLVVSLGLLAVSSTASATDVTGPLTFVGTTPCRIVETRTGFGYSGVNGPPSLVANETRTFQITGTVPGVPSQCGIPSTAVAISVNFTVANFAGAGDLRVFPAGTPVPNASILNYALENVANATTVPLGVAVGGDAPEFGITVQADGSGTDFIADVNGYYVPRPFTTLESGQTLRGAYAGAIEATGAANLIFASFTFPVPLASAVVAPDANFILAGAASTANCPGTAANPAALPGQLCMYETSGDNRILQCIGPIGALGCRTSDTLGALLSLRSAGAGRAFSYGTWAVTAP